MANLILPAHLNPRAGTPGRKTAGGVSTPGDPSKAVRLLAQFHQMSGGDAAAFLRHAMEASNKWNTSGVDPQMAIANIMLELCLTARCACVDGQTLIDDVNELLKVYVDLTGYLLDEQGEAFSERKYTEGHLTSVN